jgi:hypothetical protein
MNPPTPGATAAQQAEDDHHDDEFEHGEAGSGLPEVGLMGRT